MSKSGQNLVDSNRLDRSLVTDHRSRPEKRVVDCFVGFIVTGLAVAFRARGRTAYAERAKLGLGPVDGASGSVPET